MAKDKKHRYTVYITQNFDQNLESIRLFLEGQEVPHIFHALLKQLFETIIPNVEHFPGIGVNFLARQPESVEGLARLQALQARLDANTELREYISGDYLLLYAVRGNDIYFLSIKHHRQLSFDLRKHWSYPDSGFC